MQKSLWNDLNQKPSFHAVNEDIECDVLIVGGGIAGLSTAMELKGTNLKIAIVEAREIAELASGRTTAKLTPLHQAIYRRLKDEKERAQVYAKANSHAVSLVKKWIRDNYIDCDLEQVPAVTFAIKEDDNYIIDEELKAAAIAGLKVREFDRRDSPVPCTRGVIHDDSYSFHVKKYLLGLAKVLSDSGVQIFENSRVQLLDNKTATANTFKIHAQSIVITTQAPILSKGLFFAKTFPKRSYIVGVKLKSGRLPQHNMIAVGNNYHSIRSVPSEQLLLIGGEEHKVGQEVDAHKRIDALINYTKEHFDIAAVPYQWSSQDLSSHDDLPFIGAIEDGLYVATGFSLWGMTQGTLAGYLIGNHIQNNKILDWSKYYDPNRTSSLFNLQSLKQNADSSTQLVLDHFKPKAKFKDIPNGSGKVVQESGEELAVYRGTDGDLKVVSAVCTHMGGLVQFNKLEKTWDCPCHGARFDLNGQVINGPASKPLEDKKSIPLDDDQKKVINQ